MCRPVNNKLELLLILQELKLYLITSKVKSEVVSIHSLEIYKYIGFEEQ